jgi:hypothetical protein
MFKWSGLTGNTKINAILYFRVVLYSFDQLIPNLKNKYEKIFSKQLKRTYYRLSYIKKDIYISIRSTNSLEYERCIKPLITKNIYNNCVACIFFTHCYYFITVYIYRFSNNKKWLKNKQNIYRRLFFIPLKHGELVGEFLRSSFFILLLYGTHNYQVNLTRFIVINLLFSKAYIHFWLFGCLKKSIIYYQELFA